LPPTFSQLRYFRANDPTGGFNEATTDVSPHVWAAAKIGEWTGAVHLTFVRANPSPPGRPEPDTFIRVGRVSVEHRE